MLEAKRQQGYLGRIESILGRGAHRSLRFMALVHESGLIKCY